MLLVFVVCSSLPVSYPDQQLSLAANYVPCVATVKHENFKTCDQSGFCKRNRALADDAAAKGPALWNSPYRLDPQSVSVKAGQLQGIILKSLGEGTPPVRLPLSINFLESGVVRITVDEERRQKGEIKLRHESQIRKERYNEASEWAIVGGLNVNKDVTTETSADETIVTYGPKKNYTAIIRHFPFAIDFLRDGEVHVKLNNKGLMNVEHWREKIEKEIKEGEEPGADASEDESTWWEESFGGNTDSKPRGPESIGLDITFPGYEHVFGIPGHATPLSLKETRYVALYLC